MSAQPLRLNFQLPQKPAQYSITEEKEKNTKGGKENERCKISCAYCAADQTGGLAFAAAGNSGGGCQNRIDISFCTLFQIFIVQQICQRDKTVQPVRYALPAFLISADPFTLPYIRPYQIQMSAQAYLLNDEDLKKRAKRYIDAILAAQKEDGWICPCALEERDRYASVLPTS